MKAPEKIWLDSRSVFLNKPNKSGLTEYTRTDAFIDKAAIWFNNNLGHDECGVIAYQFDTEEEMLKDFIEYMKEE